MDQIRSGVQRFRRADDLVHRGDDTARVLDEAGCDPDTVRTPRKARPIVDADAARLQAVDERSETAAGTDQHEISRARPELDPEPLARAVEDFPGEGRFAYVALHMRTVRQRCPQSRHR